MSASVSVMGLSAIFATEMPRFSIHSCFNASFIAALKLVCLCRESVPGAALFGKRTERGLKRIDKFDLELSVYLIARELRCNVAAKP